MIGFDYPGINDSLLAWLREDIGTGDVTTSSCVPAVADSTGEFVVKQPGIICGLDVISRVYKLINANVRVTPYAIDGESVESGDIVAGIWGQSQAILTGERLVLNLLQHMSGIATMTAQAVKAVSGTQTRITDTRKTTPGMRVFDKYAVRCGGGSNHRLSLADGVLIKDNHINAAGGIANAIELARERCPHTLRIEVETESLLQVEEALEAGADIIMLDNMDPELMASAVKLIGGRAVTEASGNMGDRDLKTVAATGVDYISIGALTHSVKALDISLKFR